MHRFAKQSRHLRGRMAQAEPTIKREPAKKEEAPSSPFNFLPDVPLKLSDVPKTLLETPSSVPTPDCAHLSLPPAMDLQDT